MDRGKNSVEQTENLLGLSVGSSVFEVSSNNSVAGCSLEQNVKPPTFQFWRFLCCAVVPVESDSNLFLHRLPPPPSHEHSRPPSEKWAQR